MIHFLKLAFNWLFIKKLLWTLSIATVFISIITCWFIIPIRGKDKFAVLVISLTIIAFSLISSYYILFTPIDSLQKAFTLLGSAILFF